MRGSMAFAFLFFIFKFLSHACLVFLCVETPDFFFRISQFLLRLLLFTVELFCIFSVELVVAAEAAVAHVGGTFGARAGRTERADVCR